MIQNQYEAFKQLYKVKRLESTDKIESFDCGDNDLNDFILNQSSLFRTEKLAVSYVLKDKNNPQDIVAFFSLSNDKISISDFDDKTKYNRFSRRFNNRKRLKSYPSVKIGRFAVSKCMKGKNFGSLLIKFIKTFFAFYNQTGCRFLTVDAYSDAIPFYQKNGFIPLNEEDANDKTRLLYFDLNDVSD